MQVAALERVGPAAAPAVATLLGARDPAVRLRFASKHVLRARSRKLQACREEVNPAVHARFVGYQQHRRGQGP